jgi:hypothetical protein
LFVVVAGCGAEPDLASNYTLNLVPRVLDGQEPFADGATVKLWVEAPGAEPEILYGGVADRGIELVERPPIPAGSRVGLVVEEDGEASDQYDPGRLQAWGWTTLVDELALGGDAATVQVTVPESYALGALDKLAASKAAILSAPVMIPGGDVLLFGGTSYATSSTAITDRILRLRDNDAGDWSFGSAGKLPAGPLMGVAAAVAERAGEARVVVAGGSFGRQGDAYGPDDCVAWGGVFDPVTETWPVDRPRLLSEPMCDATALALNNGHVLIVGSFTYLIDKYASYLLYDPFDERIVAEGVLDGVGSLGVMAAARGNEGALVCGGSVLTQVAADTPIEPLASCYRLDLQGTAFPATPLPQAVAFGSMVGLSSGQVLLTGGMDRVLNDRQAAPASGSAWLFDGSGWGQVGDLKLPRAFHRSVPMHDGGALLVGGAGSGGLWTREATSPVDCVERFNPETGQFQQRGCSAAGSGAVPGVAWWPGDGAFGLEGYDELGDGGRSYGLIGVGPPDAL